ncbi:MAG: hypothetical protein IJZ55_08925 [Lachnospiraceae bacterium]|nr:hypothetical protein [Lachnospiraceae bacterium]
MLNGQDEPRVVGYVRTYVSNIEVVNYQINMIHRFCFDNGYICDGTYIDNMSTAFCEKDRERAEGLGLSTSRGRQVFMNWELMMLRALQGELDIILVDCYQRLYNGPEQKMILEAICRDMGVTIIEIGPYSPEECKCMPIIYHCAAMSEHRPISGLKAIDKLYEEASRLCSSRGRLYLDWNNMSRKWYEKIKEDDVPKIIVVTRLELLNRKLCSVVEIAKNAKIFSLEEGCIEIHRDCSWLRDTKKVVIYDKQRTLHERDISEIQQEKFEVFTRTKTKWDIADMYIDTIRSGMTGLGNLVETLNCYDVVLMDSLVKLGENAGVLFKVLRRLNKPLYTLKEGEILWNTMELPEGQYTMSV